MHKGLSLFLTFLMISGALKAQNLYPDHRFKVIENGDTLHFPFAGGMNSPILAEIDLNGDGLKDILSLEKTSGRVMTFVNSGQQGDRIFNYAPQYESLIPEVDEWIRTYDYDCDGDMDLFTYTVSYTFTPLGEGVTRVYRNDFIAGSGPSFTLVNNELLTGYGTLVKVIPSSPVNLPALADVDGDGDMDILTFSLSSNYVEYHKNYSMDSTGVCWNFVFHVDPDCWGFFKLSGVANIGILNSNCQQIPDHNLHSGSVLTAFDHGCDGDVDVINGDILGTNLLYLENGGTAASAFVTSQDSLFPSYDVPVDFANLPGAYLIDGDNDGDRDMIITAFGIIGEDFNNVLFYRNTTDNCTNVFNKEGERFLVQDMIDLGTSSAPVFFDVNADGLDDIIAGNDYYFSQITSQKVASLALYINTGTATVPEYTLSTRDFAGISAFGLLGAYPAFGDLDGDGDKDMLLGNTNGDLIYFQNTGGSPPNFSFTTPAYQGIDVGANSMPQLIDIDRDGLTDLLIGERTGVLNYYRNTGTAASPVFTQVTQSFGNVNVIQPGAIQGNSAPVLFDNNGVYELFVGAENGYIYHYNNIDGNLAGTFTLLDTMYGDIDVARRALIALSDADGDGLRDLLCGNFAGGLQLFTHVNTGVSEQQEKHSFRIYPVPASEYIYIEAEGSGIIAEISIFDSAGRNWMEKSYRSGSGRIEADVKDLLPGFYLIRIVSGGKMETHKLIVQ